MGIEGLQRGSVVWGSRGGEEAGRGMPGCWRSHALLVGRADDVASCPPKGLTAGGCILLRSDPPNAGKLSCMYGRNVRILFVFVLEFILWD